MNMLKAFPAVLLFVFFLSCKGDDAPGDKQFSKFEDQVSMDASDENIKSLFAAYAGYIKENKGDTSEVLLVLDRAFSKATELKKNDQAIAFLMSTIRFQSDNSILQQQILDLASMMAKMGKNNASLGLYYSFMKAYPEHPQVTEIRSNLPAEFSSIDTFIQDLGKKIFENKQCLP